MKIILPISFIAITIILFFVAVKPLYGQVKQLKLDVSAYSLALDNSKQLQETRDGLVEKYKNIEAKDKSRLEHLLPNDIGNIDLILEVEKIANLNGMPIKNIKFEPPKTKSSDNSQDTSSENPPESTNSYGVFPMEFVIEGSYSNFLGFLDDLEHNLRLVDIKSVSFEIPDTKEKTDPNIYTYTLKVEAYWLK